MAEPFCSEDPAFVRSLVLFPYEDFQGCSISLAQCTQVHPVGVRGPKLPVAALLNQST
jgi:hypothetical protein